MSKFKMYSLTTKQIRGIANIVAHEQGTKAGRYAEASQIANRAELYNGGDPVKTVTSGWYAHGKSRYAAGTSNSQAIEIVKDVFLRGHRTLPIYVDEHDCMSDISKVLNKKGQNIKWSKSKWKAYESLIKNKMSSNYYFYSFPGGYKSGVDPFGYTGKKKSPGNSSNFHYVLGTEPASEWGRMMPTIKKGSTGKTVKLWQMMLEIKITGTFDENTEKATKEFQMKYKLKPDGIVGGFTWSAAIGELR